MALEFNGVDGRIDYPSIHVPVGSPFSFSCRFSLSALSGSEYFLLIESGVDDFGLTVWLRDDAGEQGLAVTCSGVNASVLKYAAPQTLSVDSWYDLVVTWDGSISSSAVHIYLNNVELTYSTSTDGISPLRAQDGNWIIGGRATDNLRSLSGRLADVGAWSAILSALDRERFGSGLPPTLILPERLVFDVRFVGGDTSDKVSLNTGQVIGSPIPHAHPTSVLAISSLQPFSKQDAIASNDGPVSTNIDLTIGSELPCFSQSVSASISPSVSSIAVTDDFEGGNTDVNRVEIHNSNSLTPEITLYARPNRNVEGAIPDPIYYGLACRITGLLNKSPKLKLNLTDAVPYSIYGNQGWPTNWRAWFSYDNANWERMSDSSVVGNFQEVSHNSNFTHDTVYVATRPPYNPSRVRAHIDSIKGSVFVSETQSSFGQNYVYGESSATTRDGDGLAVPALDLISYRISDDSVFPIDGSQKRKAVLISGLHASEDQGNWQLQFFVDYLLSGSAAAASLLRNWEFFVYPLVNPSGRWGNAYRGTLQIDRLTEDPNRDWPGGVSAGRLQVVTATRIAIEQDTSNSISAFIDFHGRFREADSIFRFPNPVNDGFIAFVNARHAVASVESTSAGGVAETYFRTAFNVPLAVTSEGAAVVTSVEDYAFLGEALAQGLHDSFLTGAFPARNVSSKTAFRSPVQNSDSKVKNEKFRSSFTSELLLF